jgi:NAD+ kinase
MKLAVVANIDKPRVEPALRELLPWLRERADVVDVDEDEKLDLAAIDVDALLALGGDGTLLSIARRLDGRPTPVMGVNFGRLGFLASFTPGELRPSLEKLIAGELPVGPRIMIDASVVPAGPDHGECCDPELVRRTRTFHSRSLNDAVVTAGQPFRMIDLRLGTEGDLGVSFFGDGLIVSTPSGSTAYNISAGGPILIPPLQAFCVTPLCPHSLSFRPVVLPAETTIMIECVRVHKGTTLVCDGQKHVALRNGDRVILRRARHDLFLVENPNARQWRVLAEKLHWASTPRYNHGP